ncbi:hypothetical protein LNP80_20145 [Chryseobacterium sp. C-39]|uniref:Lipoprotein n=1 Tax=Chryseobacterium muglaense TaxID=2893752 RepID=A0A9Q3V049_9FLAO|nr:hypothetical protein [Chryseobacterium muglaense]MCC9036519.1 hypothetical protein [Chryseobacterium muglaense]MCC9036524.1 hypothetical protein [Chryseobacterium muglaense]
MKINKLSLLLITCILLLSCKDVEFQIEEIRILYNSEKYKGKKYDVSIDSKFYLTNNSNDEVYYNINDIDTVNILIKDTYYIMTIINDSLKPQRKIKPKEKIYIYYKADYHQISNNYDNPIITKEISKSIITTKKKYLIKKSSDFIVKSRLKAYIKNSYYTPNKTKIEEVGE